MIDNSCWGSFWTCVANDEFDLQEFKKQLNQLPDVEGIHDYLQNLSDKPVDRDLLEYHYLMLQAGSFGSKQIYEQDGKWKNNSFRTYWKPTATSNRRSPVNPMMPMPDTLFNRVSNIVSSISGCFVASKEDVFSAVASRLPYEKNAVVYIDPPYQNTTGYSDSFDIFELINLIDGRFPVYVSEGFKMPGATKSYLLSKGRAKGNISGNTNKPPVEEWLNRFN